MKKLIFFVFVFQLCQSAGAVCIPVSGLQFERISGKELLGIKNNKNFAVLTISTSDSRYQRDGYLPENMNSFRFFSDELCTDGAESRFHIDGKLFFLNSVQLFKK